jgi:perosamine synthetase
VFFPVEDFLNQPIPLARPNITQAEIDAVVAVMRTPHLSLGPKVPEFENAFAAHCGTRHAVACINGTAALHLVVRAMGIGPGDEVVTTPFSFVASANCVLMENATPVFADIDPQTWNIDPQKVAAAITKKTKAVIPVDVFGQPADFSAIKVLARTHNLKLIEDSCEALGSSYHGRQAGSLGDVGVFGFYPNKQITTGEGGMIVTDDAELAGLCRSIRNQGRAIGGGWLAHPRLGYNYRLSDINSAIGHVQLGRLGEIIAERNRVVRQYKERLAGETRITLQKVAPGIEMSWFVFVVRLVDRYNQSDRDRILAALTERGIGCNNYFVPIHLQPFFVEQFSYRPGSFPVCEALAARTIALPFHHELSASDIDRVCETLRSLL